MTPIRTPFPDFRAPGSTRRRGRGVVVGAVAAALLGLACTRVPGTGDQAASGGGQALGTLPPAPTSVITLELVGRSGPDPDRPITQLAGMRVNWFIDSDVGVASYRAERTSGAPSASSVWTLLCTRPVPSANENNCDDANVQLNTTYTYRVFAVNAAGSSVPVMVTVKTPGPPEQAPTNVRITADSATTLMLRWDAPGGLINLKYDLQRFRAGVLERTFRETGVDAGAGSDFGLTAGVVYTYRVRVTNGYGDGPWSSFVTFAIPTPPPPPTNFSAFADTNLSILLNWLNPCRDCTSLFIQRREVPTGTLAVLSLPGTATTTLDNGNFLQGGKAAPPQPSKTYEYVIQNENSALPFFAQTGPFSSPALATTPSPPRTPTNLRATVLARGIRLDWTQPDNNAHGWDVWRLNDKTKKFAPLGTAPGLVFGDATCALNATCQYQVRATSPAGNSAFTATVSVKESSPDAPTGLTATFLATGVVQLKWKDVASEASYRVVRSPDGKTGWIDLPLDPARQPSALRDATSFEDRELPPHTSFFYKVYAVNLLGQNPSGAVQAKAACTGAAGCDDLNPCTKDACTSSLCTHPANAAGTACADADKCNGAETCNGKGVCSPAPARLNCDDGRPCTDDLCDPAMGCYHGATPAGTHCGTATFCDGTGSCGPFDPSVCTMDNDFASCGRTDCEQWRCSGGGCFAEGMKGCQVTPVANCLHKSNGHWYAVFGYQAPLDTAAPPTNNFIGAPAGQKPPATFKKGTHVAAFVVDIAAPPNVVGWVLGTTVVSSLNAPACTGLPGAFTSWVVTLKDWQGNVMTGETVVAIDPAGTERASGVTRTDGTVTFSLLGDAQAIYHFEARPRRGGTAREGHCSTRSDGARTCPIVAGIPVDVTVQRAVPAGMPGAGGTVPVNAVTVQAYHRDQGITRPVEDSLFVPRATTNAAGVATFLVVPGQVYRFASQDPANATHELYFSHNPCNPEQCSHTCDHSLCVVNEEGIRCEAATIDIGTFDPALPEARSIAHMRGGSGNTDTGNGFMKLAADRLKDLALNQKTFQDAMKDSFGDFFDGWNPAKIPKVEQLRQEILTGKAALHALPPVQFVEPELLGDHMGAYSKDRSIVYLSAGLSSERAREGAYFMEIGHHIGQFVRPGEDDGGCEADIFFLEAKGIDLSREGLALLHSRNDSLRISDPEGVGQIWARFSFWDWTGGAWDFVKFGIFELATGFQTTLWTGGLDIENHLYARAAGAAAYVWDDIIKDGVSDLTEAAKERLKEWGALGFFYRLNVAALKFALGDPDFTKALLEKSYVQLQGLVKDKIGDLKGIRDALDRIESGDIVAGFGDLAKALAMASSGPLTDLDVLSTELIHDIDSLDNVLFAPEDRALTSAELDTIWPIFCGSVDYNDIKVKEGGGPVWWLINRGRLKPGGSVRAISIDGTIYLFGDKAIETLVHETTHVWQYQNGGPAYKLRSIDAQLAHGKGAYPFAPSLDAGKTWTQLGPEQQAFFVESAFLAHYWDDPPALRTFHYPAMPVPPAMSVDYTLPASEMATQVMMGEGAATGLDLP
jgi:hypothetical protein